MNPYAWNRVNTDLVFGRQKILDELLNGLPSAQPTSYALTGGRRMGKTTVLRSVARELNEGRELWQREGLRVIPIYIDGLSLVRPVSAELIWGDIATALARAINQNDPTGTFDFLDFQIFARNAIASLPDAVRVVVIFDEIEPLLVEPWCDGFFANWRALLSNSPGLSGSFSAVFSGARELVKLREDVGSPLMDILEFRSLRNLRYEDVVKLMELPVDTVWPEPIRRQVFNLSGGQPMLVQYLMQAACGRAKETPPEQAVHDAAASFIATRGWQFSDWWYKYCTPESQKVYLALVSAGAGGASLQELVLQFGARVANESLEVLQHVGVVVSADDGLSAQPAGAMFEQWQRTYGVVQSTVGHDPRLYDALAQIDVELAIKYASAWSILESEHPNYSGAVSEMRDTVTLVLHALAPDAAVMSAPGFTLEKGVDRPTRRQRVKFIVTGPHSAATKSLPSDIEMLIAQADQFSVFVGSAYSVASALTHTTAPRQLAYQSLKQGDSILAQLVASV